MATSAAFGAPDLFVPIVGFRQWALEETGLRSPFAGRLWRTTEQHAICAAGCHTPSSAPVKECSCGIYAWYSPCPRLSSVMSSLVAGVVVLWGRIELHRTGMRAAHAQIVGLELPAWRGRKRRQLERVAHELGVPAVAHQKLKTLGAEHGEPIARSLAQVLSA